MMTLSIRLLVKLCVLACIAIALPAASQDMMDKVDLTTPEWNESDTSRAELEELLEQTTDGEVVDLTNRRFSGLDLSGIDFKGADMRWTRMNNTVLINANFRNANLDLAWMVGANMKNADFSGASLFSTQMRLSTLNEAIFDNARIVANFKGADLTGASFRHANMAADMKNQSMGLMGTVMTSSKLFGADFSGADMSRVNAEFAKFNNAILDDVNLFGSKLGGADFSGASVKNLVLNDADLQSTTLRSLKHSDSIIGLEQAKNLPKGLRN